MAKIQKIISSEILDSRGYPTLETEVFLEDGLSAKASVPSGASRGKYEAYELRDNDPQRYNGKGVLKAVKNVSDKLSSLLKGVEISDQTKIDQQMIKLDSTGNKLNLGANSILSVSLACCRAAAISLKLPLYRYINRLFAENLSWQHQVVPLFNVINGGLHGNSDLSFQEFILIPCLKSPFSESLRMGVELYHFLKKQLKENKFTLGIGDEGGFTPSFSSNEEALSFLDRLIQKKGYQLALDIHLGLDIAANTFFDKGIFKVSDSKKLTEDDYLEEVIATKNKYKLAYLEDALPEEDFDNWQKLTAEIGSVTKIVGDDLLTTNKERLLKAIKMKACNSILIKPNQIGTLSETLEVIRIAQKANFTVIISHRSGETNDDFIADLAVAVNADFVKFGAPVRGERVAKYNRLLEIYEEINSKS